MRVVKDESYTGYRIYSQPGMLAAGWLAVHNPHLSPTPLVRGLLSEVIGKHQEDDLIDTWQRLGALQTIRAFARQRATLASRISVEPFAMIVQQEGTVWWNDVLLGKLEVLFQHTIPQEQQARLAYETFRYRFLCWLEQHYRILSIEITDAVVTIFVPDGVPSPDLTEAWQRFITFAFSTTELQQTFILLLNSAVLSNRGFSVPDVPLITLDQIDVLIAFFTATLRRLTKHDQTLARLEGVFADLQRTHAERAQRIRTLAQSYTSTATRQLKVTRTVREKAVTRIEELLALPSDTFFRPPLLLSRELPEGEMRFAGDFAKGVCYACGSKIPHPSERGKKVTYTANKLILQAPSQTLQSHFQQVQPEVCAMCAVLALACPVKTVNTSLIVSLSETDKLRNRMRYLYEHQLRMLTTGELNITAGRYLMIQCTEQAPDGRPMIERLGRMEYALLKVASLFSADVLARFQIEALVGTNLMVLKRRHVITLRFLLEVFGLQLDLDSFRHETDRPRYAAFAEAVRYVEHDHLIFALYQLVTGLQHQTTYSTIQRALLEDGLAAYKEQLHMDGETQVERRFRDIAGLTGVLYAFVSHAKSRLSQDTSGGNGANIQPNEQRDRELKKLLEQVDNPNHFTYEAAGALLGQMAQLWRTQQTYFIYDEAKHLLQEVAQVEVAEREEVSANGQPVLKLFYDDICKIYAVLYERRYPSEKARRDFTYELKLSLYSRFPELRPGNQNQ